DAWPAFSAGLFQNPDRSGCPSDVRGVVFPSAEQPMQEGLPASEVLAVTALATTGWGAVPAFRSVSSLSTLSFPLRIVPDIVLPTTVTWMNQVSSPLVICPFRTSRSNPSRSAARDKSPLGGALTVPVTLLPFCWSTHCCL